MSDNSITSAKRRPDFIAFTVRSQGNNAGPKYTRIGVGFTLKNGGVSVLYDAIPLSGQIVLIDTDAEKPGTLSYSHPNHRHDFEASMVRDSADGKGYWTEVGVAYRQEGYISILLDAVPTGGKIILTQPKERE
jgi:hypothetical protein